MVETFTSSETDVEDASLKEMGKTSDQMAEPSMESMFLIKQFAHNFVSQQVGSVSWSVSLN